jgi:LacI family transcriptional regulator, sucrose operon repressor
MTTPSRRPSHADRRKALQREVLQAEIQEYYWDFIVHDVSKKLSSYDGVFCSNDLVAYALYLFAIQHRISVPEQLKIVGYDYHSFTRMLQNPKITTVKQPIERLGTELCSTLINMIESTDHDTIHNTIIDVELIKGDTT